MDSREFWLKQILYSQIQPIHTWYIRSERVKSDTEGSSFRYSEFWWQPWIKLKILLSNLGYVNVRFFRKIIHGRWKRFRFFAIFMKWSDKSYSSNGFPSSLLTYFTQWETFSSMFIFFRLIQEWKCFWWSKDPCTFYTTQLSNFHLSLTKKFLCLPQRDTIE